jgi:four helix bundle protein
VKVTRFEDLDVWKAAKDLSVAVYRATQAGPFARDFALRDQIRRAAVSVMSNIAEGFGRHSRPEFRHFLSIARGSVSEVRSQLHLARELGYLPQSDFNTLYELCWSVTRMIASLRERVSRH